MLDSDAIRFTTIGASRGSFGVVTRDEVTYGLKAHEFRKFIELPKHVPRPRNSKRPWTCILPTPKTARRCRTMTGALFIRVDW